MSATPQTAITVGPTMTVAPLSPETRAKIFDDVWQSVADHYLYQDFRGVDWGASRRHYRPLAIAATTTDRFYGYIAQMINDLHDDHSRFISPQVATEEQHISDGTEAYVGVGVIIDPNETNAVVTTVFPDSPAATAGVRRRDHILLVGGKPVQDVDPGLRGPAGSTVTLRIQSPGTKPRDVVVAREAVTARYVPEAYRLEGTDVGYLLIQSFWSEAMARDVKLVLQRLVAGGALRGLVIDLRGNGGGWRSVLEGILSNFMTGNAGEFYDHDHGYPLVVTENELYPSFAQVPIAVLVDQHTESYAEIMAASLQAAIHAKVIGTTTAGNTETIYAHDFEDRSRLWLAQEGFKLPDGTGLEGRGVHPDVVVDAQWMNFSEVEDPQITAALHALGQTQTR